MSSLQVPNLSGITLTNENNIAAVIVKCDFSLFKCEPSTEFAPIGLALSQKRRIEAEEGPQHKIARRLAALFEQTVPSTPKLLSAFGTRLSEIMATPGVNPSGTSRDGPFKDFVGADGTGIWAAATSGTAALAMYLLASLIAQLWDSQNAIALWVELVETRRNHVKEAVSRNEMMTSLSVLGAQQDFPRQDLASWDASARSWLRCAEKAKSWEHHQLMLILKNVQLKFTAGETTYERVIISWQGAMKGLEDILSGRPQRIDDAALVAAFQAWNIYPDLIVLGRDNVNVKFKDHLVPPNAVITVGGTISTDQPGSPQWSLALSHLRYYGRSNTVLSAKDHTRISNDGLRLMILGSQFSLWNLAPRDIHSAALVVQSLWVRLGQTDRFIAANKDKYLPWLRYLAQAAELLVSGGGEVSQDRHKLVLWGRRRAKALLSVKNHKDHPFFGMSTTGIVPSLSHTEDVDCGVEYLRDIALRIGLENKHGFIVYSHGEIQKGENQKGENQKDKKREFECFEIATVSPISLEEYQNTQGRPVKRHVRWFLLDGKGESSLTSQFISGRTEHLRQKGEVAVQTQTAVSKLFNDLYTSCNWKHMPMIFHTCLSSDASTTITDSDANHSCNCSSNFSSLYGNGQCGLFIKKDHIESYRSTAYYKRFQQGYRESYKLQEVSKRLNGENINERWLWNYLCMADSTFAIKGYVDQTFFIDFKALQFIATAHQINREASRSLHAMVRASLVHDGFSDATISPDIISRPLYDVTWLSDEAAITPEAPYLCQVPMQAPLIWPTILRNPSLEEAFSCIIYLQSGNLVVDPANLQSVFALCYENSMFVTRRILEDPGNPVDSHDVVHIVGNIGRPGMSLLTAPPSPDIRDLGKDYRLVTHAAYDGKREDNFHNTSLHLSFTQWVFPISTEGNSNTIDNELNLVESVIHAFDGVEWIADLDPMSIEFETLLHLEEVPDCKHGMNASRTPASQKLPTETHSTGEEDDGHMYQNEYVSLDTWEELLDPPDDHSVGILRAHGNWVARLTALSILAQRGQAHSVGLVKQDTAFCITCLEEKHGDVAEAYDDNESCLPSFCLD